MNAREYSDRLFDLLRSERHAMADFLVALSDFDGRRLWLDLGYASLFAFLQRQLRLSDGAAFYRQTAAHLIQKFPGVVEPLRDGRLCLTTVFELSKVLTADNAASVLPRFLGISKREAKEIVAELTPQPAPERTVFTAPRELPLRAPDPDQSLLGQPSTSVPTSTLPPQEVRSPPPAPAARTVVEPKNATSRACPSPSPAPSRRSSPPRATRSRTSSPAPRTVRCSRPRSTSSSRRRRSAATS